MLLPFPRAARIGRGMELQRIAREGKRIRTTCFEVRVVASPTVCLENNLPRTRIGLIVPRYKHSAVARNRLKRRLRELVRLRILTSGISGDVVIRTRVDAYDASFDSLAADIIRVIDRLR